MDVPEVCKRLKTSIENGLDENEAAIRLARDGLNAFTPPKQTAWWVLYLKEMTGGFALLLWFASIATFITYGIETEKDVQDVCEKLTCLINLEELYIFQIYLGGFLALTVILTGSFSYYQQASSNKVFKSFKNMIPPVSKYNYWNF